MSILPASADNNDTTSGDASTPNIYVWGAQIESKGAPTSYIPTDASTNTRLKDQLRFKGDDGNVTNNQEGSCRIKFLVPDETDTRYSPRLLSLNDGGLGNDRIYFYVVASTEKLVFASFVTTGTDRAIGSSANIRDGELHNAFFHWATDDMKLILDDTDISTSNDVDIPDDLDRIEIGGFYASTQQVNGHIAHIKIYDRILPS
jgi:hypothetical protein